MIRNRREFKIAPLDVDKNIGIGVSLPFNGPSVFNTTYTTSDQVKANLINYFLTNNGERPFNPYYGANLRTFVFEQIDVDRMEELREDILSKLGIRFSMIDVISLTFVKGDIENSVLMNLTYKLNEQDNSLVIQLQ